MTLSHHDTVAIDSGHGGHEKEKVIWCWEPVREIMGGQMARQKKRRRTLAALFVHTDSALCLHSFLASLRPAVDVTVDQRWLTGTRIKIPIPLSLI